MIIRAELKCKQIGCEADTCAVDIRLWGKLFSSRSSIIEETLTVPSHFWKPWANIRLKT